MEVDVEVGKKISFRQTTYLKKILERFQMGKTASRYQFSLIKEWPTLSFHPNNKLNEPQLSGINLQLAPLCGFPYIPNPTSRIQWKFLVSIVQILASFIAMGLSSFFDA